MFGLSSGLIAVWLIYSCPLHRNVKSIERLVYSADTRVLIERQWTDVNGKIVECYSAIDDYPCEARPNSTCASGA